MNSDNWESHSQLIDYREEAASVVVAGQVKLGCPNSQNLYCFAKSMKVHDFRMQSHYYGPKYTKMSKKLKILTCLGVPRATSLFYSNLQ